MSDKTLSSKARNASQIIDPGRSPKRRRRKKKKHREIFDIPGVYRIVLSELAQKFIGCVAGEQVTSENPWTYVKKDLLLDNLDLHEESSEFLPIKKEILEFPAPNLLIGYIPDETKDYDEFYICITQEAMDKANEIIQKIKTEQEERLINTINKNIRKWVSLGTDAEVDEAIVRNNRPLIEVEVESAYPIFSAKAEFTIVPAEKRRDGYMELRSADEHIVNVHLKRIDAAIQAAPQYASSEAQTICPYPSNSATQYQYEVQYTEELLEKCKKNIVDYTKTNYEQLSDLLRVNGAINLYADDYSDLMTDAKLTKSSAIGDIKEYLSFTDVELCKGKMITDAVWHPMWTGVVAIAYADAAPTIYHNGPNMEDNVLRAVHGLNIVLIWSCLDGLRPKLILETHREVNKLAFCKFDENILIGGCKNGQIIIWDIRNKLQKVEELEILTTAQQKYRNYMNTLMDWMKVVHSLSLVRPTAVSDLRFSHKGPVTGITWLCPFYEFSKLGSLTAIAEENEHSMQFVTSSEDGTILIWDLLKKPTIQPGGFKLKKLRRLKKRPSALLAEVSPYQILHLNLKPIYKVSVTKKENKNKLHAISNSYGSLCNIQYEELNVDKSKNRLLHESRVLYKPILDRSLYSLVPQPKMHIGTMEGHHLYVQWEGQDFDSGEIVNSESSVILLSAKYHDGPVNTVQTSECSRITLTVGGKIFALWREDFPERPILWRRNKQYMYSSGEWNIFQPYIFTNKIMNGYVQSWMMYHNSKLPFFSLTFSSSYLTASAMHPLKVKKNIYGAGDKQGTFRLYFMPEDTASGSTELKTQMFNDFIDREIARKKKFLKWQADWCRRNTTLLQEKISEQKEANIKEEEAKKAKEAEKLEEKCIKVQKRVPQPGKYIEWIIEQRQLQEEARIKATVISKKQLDTKELEKRRKPLQKLDEENERKKRKQKQRLKEGDKIFQDTVASLFPDVIKEKPAPPPDPYAAKEALEARKETYRDFYQISVDATDFICKHPFTYEFDWKQVLASGKLRRSQLGLPLRSASKSLFHEKSSTDNFIENE